MKPLSLFLTVLILATTTLSTIVHASNETADPAGLWLTQNKRAAINVTHCGDALCGKIHWIIKDGMVVDSKNPDSALATRPLCGLEILNGFTQDKKNPTKWDNGKIYKADEGDIYNATITVIDNATLNLRGYVGIPLLGKTQTWARVDKKSYPRCKAPK